MTVRDIVRAQARALDELGLIQLQFVVGGSLGGMQALQWALAFPERVAEAIVIGAHDHHTAMGIALNAIQRECLELDPVRGVRTARKLAILSYKSEELLRRGMNDGPTAPDGPTSTSKAISIIRAMLLNIAWTLPRTGRSRTSWIPSTRVKDARDAPAMPRDYTLSAFLPIGYFAQKTSGTLRRALPNSATTQPTRSSSATMDTTRF